MTNLGMQLRRGADCFVVLSHPLRRTTKQVILRAHPLVLKCISPSGHPKSRFQGIGPDAQGIRQKLCDLTPTLEHLHSTCVHHVEMGSKEVQVQYTCCSRSRNIQSLLSHQDFKQDDSAFRFPWYVYSFQMTETRLEQPSVWPVRYRKPSLLYRFEEASMRA